MTASQQSTTSRIARIGRSVEIQNGRRGLSRTLRRGLHGAKNWVLEPDEDGLPRSPWAKLLRVLVILAPVWIILSAATGGPERGHSQIGLGQAFLSALTVTLVGLGFLSARERRQGREEPWAELPETSTLRDDAEPTTLADPASENPTEVLENAQVSEAGSGGGVITPGDIPDKSDHTSQIPSEVATRVDTAPLSETSSEGVVGPPFVQVDEGDRGVAESGGSPVTRVDASAETQVINRHNSNSFESDHPTLSLIPAGVGGHPVTISLAKTPKAQVSNGSQVDTAPPEEGTEHAVRSITDRSGPPEWDGPKEPVTPVVTQPVQETLFPQVNEGDHAVTEVVTPKMAPLGPYEVTDSPVAKDWWLTKPDAVADKKPEPIDEHSVEVASADTLEAASEEDSCNPHMHQAVLSYRALKTLPNISKEEEAKVREKAAEWARREIASGRQSQRSAADILGVGKTTVGKWLERMTDQPHDPWATVDVE